MHLYIMVFICCLSLSSCFIPHKSREKLQKRGITEIHHNSYTNQHKVIIYFEPTVKEILSKMQIPYTKDTILLSYRLYVDVWRKSIVYDKMVNYTKTSSSIDISGDIEAYLFKNLKIRTKNVHIFNPPRLNVRNERTMAYAGMGIQIIGDKICIGWPTCPPSDTTKNK